MEKKQLAFLIARAQINLEVEDEEITEIFNNSRLSEHFLSLARDLDVMEAKSPEDIYKSHLENIRMFFKDFFSFMHSLQHLMLPIH